MGRGDRSHIRVKALAVVVDDPGAHHAVWRGHDPSRLQPLFHRPLGGSIEPGERSRQAVVREIDEELGATFIDISLLGVVENIFTYDGGRGHEIVFLYAGRFAELEAIPVGGREYLDNGITNWAEWRPLDPTGLDVPLYPDGLQDLIDAHLVTPA